VQVLCGSFLNRLVFMLQDLDAALYAWLDRAFTAGCAISHINDACASALASSSAWLQMLYVGMYCISAVLGDGPALLINSPDTRRYHTWHGVDNCVLLLWASTVLRAKLPQAGLYLATMTKVTPACIDIRFTTQSLSRRRSCERNV